MSEMITEQDYNEDRLEKQVEALRAENATLTARVKELEGAVEAANEQLYRIHQVARYERDDGELEIMAAAGLNDTQTALAKLGGG